jgi:hypothetical protein
MDISDEGLRKEVVKLLCDKVGILRSPNVEFSSRIIKWIATGNQGLLPGSFTDLYLLLLSLREATYMSETETPDAISAARELILACIETKGSIVETVASHLVKFATASIHSPTSHASVTNVAPGHIHVSVAPGVVAGPGSAPTQSRDDR